MKSLLALVYLFSASWIPFSDYGMKDFTVSYKDTTSVNFELGLELYDFVKVYGGEKTYQSKEKDLSFSVYEQQYYCGIDCHYAFSESMKLSAGLYRQCTHPLNAWDEPYGCNDSASLDVYIQLEGKIKLF